MKWFTATASLATIVLAAQVFCGCSDSGSSPPPTLASGTVSASGGTVTASDGSAIDVPAGAVSQPTNLAIAPGQEITLQDFDAVGPARQLGPSGMSFSTPVTVTLPFTPPSGVPPEDVVVAHRDDQTGDVTLLRPASASGGMATVELDSFSTCQVVHSRAPAPVINAVDPDVGPLAGGITVTITGQNFRGGTPTMEVYFGDVPSPNVNPISQTEVRAEVPTGTSAGPVDVLLRNADGPSGTLTDGFTYDDGAPTTTASPSGGVFSGSVDVTLSADEPATTYYTNDGSDPTTSSSVYSAPITINTTTTLKFFSVDSSNNEEQIRQEQYVANTAPVASFSVDRAAAKPGVAFNFDALGCSDGQEPSANLSVRWDWEDDGVWDTAYVTSKTASHAYADEGTKTVRLEVRDSQGAVAQTTRTLSVARTLGDLNDDGFPDVVVGADDDNAGDGTGHVYVFFGGPALTGVDLSSGGSADAVFKGEAAFDRFGRYLMTEDVNGDGIADLIVPGDENDAAGAEAGRVYIFFGGPSFSGRDLSQPGVTADVTLTGEAAGTYLGRRVAAGELDGDGKIDLVVTQVGSPKKVHVFAGPINADLDLSAGDVPDYTFTAFGWYAAVGDLNDDDQPDLLTGVRSGRVNVFFGGTGLASRDGTAGDVADVSFIGENQLDWFSFAMGVADLNGDTVDDLYVGAYINDSGGTDAGRGYVFFGGAGVSSKDLTAGDTADVTITGVSPNDRLGNHAGAGDLNADGIADLVLTADGVDDGVTDGGRTYVFFGGAALSGSLSAADADVFITGDEGGARMGRVGVRDVTGDGLSDLILGSPLHDLGGTDVGAVYLFHGGTNFTSHDLSAGDSPDATFIGDPVATRFGLGIANGP